MSNCITCNDGPTLRPCPCCRPSESYMSLDDKIDAIEQKAAELFLEISQGVICRDEAYFAIDGDLSEYEDEVMECLDDLLEGK